MPEVGRKKICSMSEYKYTEDGRKVYVHETVGDKIHRVSYVYTVTDDHGNDDGEDFDSTSVKLYDGDLYDNPPLPRLHAVAEALQNRIDAKSAELAKLKVLSKNFIGLEMLSDLLQNPVTHLVSLDGEPCIMDATDYKVSEATVAALKIRSGYGMGEMSFNWFVKDKEGYYSHRVIPCTSKEAADEILKREFSKWVKDCVPNAKTVQKCEELGIPIPTEGIKRRISEYEREMKRFIEQAAGNKKNADDYKKLIEALKAKLQ
jgi:hypothetical protein